MDNGKKQFVSKWRAKREMGRRKYVLMHGFLGFGVGLALLFSMIELITNGSFILSYMIARVVVLPTIGIIIFSNRWDSLEKKYERLLQGSSAKNPRGRAV